MHSLPGVTKFILVVPAVPLGRTRVWNAASLVAQTCCRHGLQLQIVLAENLLQSSLAADRIKFVLTAGCYVYEKQVDTSLKTCCTNHN